MQYSIYCKNTSHNDLASLHLVFNYLNYQNSINVNIMSESNLDINTNTTLQDDLLDTDIYVILLNCYISLDDYKQLLDGAEVTAGIEQQSFDRNNYKLSMLYEVFDINSTLNYDYTKPYIVGGYTDNELNTMFGNLQCTLTTTASLSKILTYYMHSRLVNNNIDDLDVVVNISTDNIVTNQLNYINLINVYERNLVNYAVYEEAINYVNAIPPPELFVTDGLTLKEIETELYKLNLYYTDDNLYSLIEQGGVIQKYKEWHNLP